MDALYYIGIVSIAVTCFGGMIWATNPKHPERLRRLQVKFLTPPEPPKEAEINERVC